MNKLRILLFCIYISPIFGALSNAERVEPVDGVFYYEPAASVYGCAALWNNPAGIGKMKSNGFELMSDYVDGEFTECWGGAIHKGPMALGYRSLDKDEGKYREYLFGFGAPLSASGTYFGFSYRYFKDGADIYNKRHTWNIGFLSQSNKKLAWAAGLSNLNRGKIDGQRSEMEQRYSLAYRPDGDKITLAVDMMLSTRTRLSNAEYVYHAEAVAADGIYVNAWMNSSKQYQIGFRVNLVKHFVGSRNTFDRHGKKLRNTVYYGATNLRQKSVIKDKQRRLSLKASGGVKENPLQPLFGKKRGSFTSIINSIYRAADDDSIAEMLLSLSRFSPGFGRAQELREAIAYFRSRGKVVVCHLGTPGNLGYYIASACDSIFIPPVSQFNLSGLRMELTFYKGLMNKIGVKAEVVKFGPHKSAPEKYTNEQSSEENRAGVNRLLDQLYDQLVGDLASARSISDDSMRSIIDNGPYTSVQAADYGLVDGLSYADDLSKGFLCRLPEISFIAYETDTLTSNRFGSIPTVAVVVVEGEVEFNSGGSLLSSPTTTATPSHMRWSLGKAIADRNVKAIVLRVNSPGGLALAGDEIHHLVQRAAETKPMVISIANVAASGGYYLAMPGARVFANPGCVTGSIGIYGGKPNLSGFYDKLGVRKELYTRGKHAGMMSWSFPFSEDEREKYKEDLGAFYDHFVSLVAASRELSVDSVDQLAQGKVWTGHEALNNGLVDQLGGLRPAADYAAELAGLEEYRIAAYPLRKTLFLLPRIASLPYLIGLLSSDDDNPLSSLLDSDSEEKSSGIYARLPFDFSVE